MSVPFEFSRRLQKLPSYLFVEIDKAKREAKAAGRDVIDLGVGDPDTGTPQKIIEALKEASQYRENHRYALDAGLPQLRASIQEWFENRFRVSLDADKEIYPLIGSKEGIAHLPLGILNPKDKVVLTDPSYPAYQSAVILAEGKIVSVPLKMSNGFLPNLAKIENIKDAKMMIVNYPNNPTAATAPKEFYADLVRLAKRKEMILVSDLAYSEIYFDGQKPVSLLEIEGAKDIAIEFHSFSKTYNMTGWRIGWACGNPRLIAALAKVKSNIDSGIFQPIQLAALKALKNAALEVEDLRALYQERRDALINGLRDYGWKITPPSASFFVWAKIPRKFKTSMETAKAFLNQADIIVTPGSGFGKSGEGFVRMTLTVDKKKINQAIDRLKKVL